MVIMMMLLMMMVTMMLQIPLFLGLFKVTKKQDLVLNLGWFSEAHVLGDSAELQTVATGNKQPQRRIATETTNDAHNENNNTQQPVERLLSLFLAGSHRPWKVPRAMDSCSLEAALEVLDLLNNFLM